MVFGDDESKVVHLSTFKFAFLQLEEQLVGMEGLEYLLSDPPMVCKGGGVDENVIHVAGELHSLKNMMSSSKSPWFCHGMTSLLSFLVFVCPLPHLHHLLTPSDLVCLPSAASTPTLRCTCATMLCLHSD